MNSKQYNNLFDRNYHINGFDNNNVINEEILDFNINNRINENNRDIYLNGKINNNCHSQHSHVPFPFLKKYI